MRLTINQFRAFAYGFAFACGTLSLVLQRERPELEPLTATESAFAVMSREVCCLDSDCSALMSGRHDPDPTRHGEAGEGVVR